MSSPRAAAALDSSPPRPTLKDGSSLTDGQRRPLNTPMEGGRKHGSRRRRRERLAPGWETELWERNKDGFRAVKKTDLLVWAI